MISCIILHRKWNGREGERDGLMAGWYPWMFYLATEATILIWNILFMAPTIKLIVIFNSLQSKLKITFNNFELHYAWTPFERSENVWLLFCFHNVCSECHKHVLPRQAFSLNYIMCIYIVRITYNVTFINSYQWQTSHRLAEKTSDSYGYLYYTCVILVHATVMLDWLLRCMLSSCFFTADSVYSTSAPPPYPGIDPNLTYTPAGSSSQTIHRIRFSATSACLNCCEIFIKCLVKGEADVGCPILFCTFSG